MTTDGAAYRDALAATARRAREQAGLSLSELSRRSGIGKATLSALEAGAGNPTIDTVFSLSRALEIPVSSLLDSSTHTVNVVRGDAADVLSAPAVDLRLLRTIEHDGLTVEVFDQQIKPGAVQDSLGHAGTEHTIVQAGRLCVTVGDDTTELGPGDAIAFDAHQPHRYRAVEGLVRSVLLLDYSPSSSPSAPPHG